MILVHPVLNYFTFLSNSSSA